MISIYVLIFVAWWSIALPLAIGLAFTVGHTDYDEKDVNMLTAVSFAIFWPLTAFCVFVRWLVLYPHKTAKELRNRMRHAGVYNDFCKWLEEKEKKEEKG